jgi:hypothetical protein
MSLLNIGKLAVQYGPRAIAGVRSLLTDPVKSTGLVTGGILGGKATEETINSGILGNSNMIQEGMNFFSSPAINFLNDIRNTPSGSILTPDQGAIDAENKFNEELNKKITTATQDDQSNILITPEVEQPSGLLTTPEIDPLDFSNTTPMPDQSLLSDYILTAEEAPETEEGLLSESSNPYYSVLAEAVLDMNFNSGSGQQILNQINNMPGIKQSEIVDTGLDNFLSGKDKVTKEELDNYILENNISTKINDVVLGDLGSGKQISFIKSRLFLPDSLKDVNSIEDAKIVVNNDYDLYEDFKDFYNASGEDLVVNDPATGSTTLRSEATTNFEELEGQEEQNAINDYLYYVHGITEKDATIRPKYESYTLPGGDNYKELLITLPTQNVINFNSSHYSGSDFPSENLLISHARFKEREIDGKKTLFIEEIQSDLHQRGRKKGYQDSDYNINVNNLNNEMRSIKRNIINLEEQLPSLTKDDYNNQINEIKNLNKQYQDAIEKRETLVQDNKKKVQDTPFKKNWHELTMKRLIKYAVDNGFEAVAYTPGEVQTERYNLANYIDNIQISPSDRADGKIYLRAYSEYNQDQIYGHHIYPDQLEEYVGKELSAKITKDLKEKNILENYKEAKILEQKGEFINIDGLSYSGLDLKVGGEGMTGFYDKILPSFLNKYLKKYNNKLSYVPNYKTESGAYSDNIDTTISFGQPIDDTPLRDAQTIEDAFYDVRNDEKLREEFYKYERYRGIDTDIVNNINDDVLVEQFLRSEYDMEYEGTGIEPVTIDSLPYFEITPEMKEEIGKKGITLAKLNSGLLSVA